MKKTLVALAALAATGAFAQVTMTGEFAYVFQQSTNGTGAQKSGQSVDTSEIYWDAKEDLGGGMRATFMNSGQVLSIGLFFSLMILGLARTLPHKSVPPVPSSAQTTGR